MAQPVCNTSLLSYTSFKRLVQYIIIKKRDNSDFSLERWWFAEVNFTFFLDISLIQVELLR